ncbi:FAD-dependent monooxygenase [Chromobacterium violaceum]|uniref:FAD-dependent monooxygenase n=1 Tax=Chromobacterium violaceum TaxID=536 RepID=UPI00068B49EB|nr:FAD-dependent monooxygenase [Chromobacterium violaceum]
MPAWHRAWSNSVGGGVASPACSASRALVDIATDQGDYQIRCDWLVACDGARSFARQALQLPFDGRTFNDRFLIADVRMPADLPAERRFWFSPSFHEGQSVLIHKQANDVWRVDFQLGPAPDPAQDREPERVAARLRRMFGDDIAFELEWGSGYDCSFEPGSDLPRLSGGLGERFAGEGGVAFKS